MSQGTCGRRGVNNVTGHLWQKGHAYDSMTGHLWQKGVEHATGRLWQKGGKVCQSQRSALLFLPRVVVVIVVKQSVAISSGSSGRSGSSCRRSKTKYLSSLMLVL